MINQIVNEKREQKIFVDNIINDIYLFPRWEVIQSFYLQKRNFFFFSKKIKIDLLRKFSLKNMIEKYSLRNSDNKIIADMNLKLYKDCVYILNLDVHENVKGAVEKLLQTAIEKSIYNTTNKEVFINISECSGNLKRILKMNGFCILDEQTNYERNLIGEIYKFSPKNIKIWTEKITHMPILINK